MFPISSSNMNHIKRKVKGAEISDSRIMVAEHG